MMLAVLALLPLNGPARAQAPLPYDVKDTSVAESLDYLSQQIRRNRTISDGLTGSTNTWSVVQNFNAPVVFNSSATFNGGVFGILSISSETRIPEQTTTQGTLNVCASGSTVTFVTNGTSDIEVCFEGAMQNTSAQDQTWGYLVDGVPGAGLTTTTGVRTVTATANTYCMNMGGCRRQAALSAGAHSVCLTWATTAATTLRIINGITTCATGLSSVNSFRAGERR